MDEPISTELVESNVQWILHILVNGKIKKKDVRAKLKVWLTFVAPHPKILAAHSGLPLPQQRSF